MRVIVFYINLCLQLLCGGNSVQTDTHVDSKHSFTQNISQAQQIKLTSTVPNTILIESTDINLDEEFHNSDDLGGTTKALVQYNNPVNNWYLIFFGQSINKDYCQRIKIFAPFCGYSNPIYIRQQVLRI